MANTLDIYRAGAFLITVDIDESTVYSEKLQNGKTITCVLKSESAIPIRKEDYIQYNGERFTINTIAEVDKDGGKIETTYSVTFEAEFYHMLDWFVKDEGEKKFPYHGTAADHLALVFASANTESSGWIIGEVDTTVEKLIEYDWTYVRAALDMIATAFTLEYQFRAKTIRMVETIGRDTGLSFELGRGKGLHQIKRSPDTSKNSVNRVYPVGGTRNITAAYRGGLFDYLTIPGEFVQTPAVTAWLNGTGPEVRIKEVKYTNEDIYPHFAGIVQSTTYVRDTAGKITSATITDPAINFDLNAQLQPGVKAKVMFQSGEMTGEEFEVSSYDAATKTTTIIPTTDTQNYTLPNDTSGVTVGDKFTYVDVIMPAGYETTAEGLLRDEALTYLDDNQYDRLIYGVKPDQKQLRDNNILLKVGDRATVVDAELEVNDILRLSEITYPLVNPFDVTAIVSNEIRYDPVVKLFADVIQVRGQVTEIDRRGAEYAKRGAQNLVILENSIFDVDGKFNSDNINTPVLSAALGIFGVKSANFLLNRVYITDNYNSDPNAVTISSGELIHLETDFFNPGNQNIWQMQPFGITGLTPSSAYYVYSKCSKTSQVGSFVVTTDQIKPNDLPGYWMFLTGIIYPVNAGYRDSDFTYGITSVSGSRIKTGIIQGNTGALSINLDTGDIFGKVKFQAANGSIKDVSDLQAQVDGIKVGVSYSSGKMLYTDPEFAGSYGASGYNGISVYNNTGSVSLVLNRSVGYSDFPGAGYPSNPNSTGCYISIRYTGGGVVSPGYGGFYFATQTRANAVFITRLVALIPVGRNIQWVSNQIGGGDAEWLTPHVGTGKWEEYLCKVTCGANGTFSSTNFFYIDAGTDSPFSWFLSYATVFDMTAAPSDPIKYADAADQVAITQANAYAASIAQSKVDIAKAATLSQASTDAQTKADAAYNNSVAASNTYAATVSNSAASAAQVAAAADASNKATTAYNNAVANAQAQYNALTQSLKGLAYQDVVQLAQLGNTVIENGMIKTTLLDANYIRANIINAAYINALSIDAGAIQTGTLSANRIDVANLIVQNLKTAPSGTKHVEINGVDNNIRVVAASGTALITIDDDAALTYVTPSGVKHYGAGINILNEDNPINGDPSNLNVSARNISIVNSVGNVSTFIGFDPNTFSNKVILDATGGFQIVQLDAANNAVAGRTAVLNIAGNVLTFKNGILIPT